VYLSGRERLVQGQPAAPASPDPEACEQILNDPQVDGIGEVIGASAACLVVGGLIVAAVFFLAAAALIFVFGVLGWVTYGIRTFLWTVLFGVLTVAGLVVLLSLFD
jgi:hypothetical protein